MCGLLTCHKELLALQQMRHSDWDLVQQSGSWGPDQLLPLPRVHLGRAGVWGVEVHVPGTDVPRGVHQPCKATLQVVRYAVQRVHACRAGTPGAAYVCCSTSTQSVIQCCTCMCVFPAGIQMEQNGEMKMVKVQASRIEFVLNNGKGAWLMPCFLHK